MKKNVLFSTLSLVSVWVIWLIAYYIIGNEWVLPSVGSAFSEMFRLFAEGAFWRAFLHTLLRTLAAFGISFILGILLAIAARAKAAVRTFLAPIISILRTVPTMAIILMLKIWTTPSVAPVVVTVLVLFPAVYAATLAALDEVGEEYGGIVRAYGVGMKRQIVRMYLPLMLPSLLKQTGAILSMGLKITVSGEILALTFRSIGGFMQEAQAYLETSRLMALTLVVVALGFLLELSFLGISKLAVRWKR